MLRLQTGECFLARKFVSTYKGISNRVLAGITQRVKQTNVLQVRTM